MGKLVPATLNEIADLHEYQKAGLVWLLSKLPDQKFSVSQEEYENYLAEDTKTFGKPRLLQQDAKNGILTFSFLISDQETRQGVSYLIEPDINDILKDADVG